MESKTRSSNHGVIVSVRGSVVDIRFDGHLPPIHSVLLAGAEKQIVIEVLAQQDARHVRGIALTPTQGLARGQAVEDTGGPLKAPVGKAVLSRMFDVFGNTIDREAVLSDVQWRSVHRAPPSLARRSTKSEVFETGIKDLLEQLNGTFHQLRQSGIDEELFDVISGFQALSSKVRSLASRADKLPAFFNSLAALSGGRMVPVPGGVLVRSIEGEVLGACGASGDTADNDEACVVAAIEAAGFVADPGSRS